jgi:Xaa-Pro aminopeptidase
MGMRGKTLLKRRADGVRRTLRANRLDGLLVSDLASVAYLTGFTGTAGLALLTAKDVFLIVDFRYFDQAAQQAPDALRVHVDRALYDEAVAQALADAGVKRVAFEADTVPYAAYLAWQDANPTIDWVPSRGLVAAQREVKDDLEIAAIRRACAITSASVTAAMAALAPGITEREIAAEIERNFKRLGADGLAFPTLVASGDRSALPHPQPSDRRIQPGECLLIDAGCTVGGYGSDMTRSLVLGRPDARQREVWDAVRAALAAGLNAIRPGVPARAVDAACRRVLAERGLEAHFGHDTGHGVGLTLHEGPRLAADSDDVLEPGMIVTVEPGVYLSGWGGVRLEELALVTANGAEVLTTAPLAMSPLSTLFT